ncbi:hypothetical protein ACGFRB_18460 [Streptomyces sp. NPDC048718]|uniref:hypothetical protein n=1 Tax=Streptomyces sp. NPDC048718 TaxID=3365587 RepID=UPI0037117DBB
MLAASRPRRRLRRRAALTATALCTAALALGATACGPLSGPEATGPFGNMTGAQISDKALAATKGADSLTMDVNMRMSDGRVKAKVSTDREGRCVGTIQVGGTGSADLIRTADKAAYIRFDERMIKGQVEGESAEVQAAVLKELKGRWMKVDPKDPDMKDMLHLCGLHELLADFETSSGAGTVKDAETTLDGKKALVLTQREGGEKTTAYVATEGTPYLLKIGVTGGKEPGTIGFSDFGKPVRVTAPAKKDMVDEKMLG